MTCNAAPAVGKNVGTLLNRKHLLYHKTAIRSNIPITDIGSDLIVAPYPVLWYNTDIRYRQDSLFGGYVHEEISCFLLGIQPFDGCFCGVSGFGRSICVVIPSHIDGLPVLSLQGVDGEEYSTAATKGVFEESHIRSVVIPETVKAIGYATFRNCKELTQVTIVPNSNLIYINEAAFAHCIKLPKMDLSATQVKGIGAFAFRGCKELEEVVFSDTLTEIREKAFYECSALLQLDLPKSLTQIAGGAFAYCTSLKCVKIPEKLNLTSLEEAIFHDVPSLEQVIFQEGREEITGYALLQTNVSLEITVPKSVKRFSPLPFLVHSSARITVTFSGDAPIITEDDTDWFGDPVIRYDPNTNGWNEFAWNGKYTLQPI